MSHWPSTMTDSTSEAWPLCTKLETARSIRSVISAQGEGLASLCFRVADIEKMHRRLDRLALKPDPITEVESRDALTGPSPRP